MSPVKSLTLLRHAKAQPGEAAAPDKDRPLNERGEHDARLMGRRLREGGTRPSLIITSPAARALQTAQFVARELGYPREFLQREIDLYLASPAIILQVLGRQDDAFNNILLCGHNPGLTELANDLSGTDIDDIPTCGLVTLEAPIRKWKHLSKGATLQVFDFPKKNPASR